MPPPELSWSPPGNAPAVIDQVYGAMPPEAVSVCEYATPTAPLGRVGELVMVTELIWIENAWLALTDALSATCTVKLNVPVAVGVPVMAPVPAFSSSPPGSDPIVTDHVYGCVPPEAVSVCEYATPTAPPGRVGGLVMLRLPEIWR